MPAQPHSYILQPEKPPSLSSLIARVRTTRQAQKLVAHHEAEARDIALPSSFPNYPEHAVSIFLRAVGLGHYHNGLVWPWFSFFFSAAMQHRGLGPSRDHAAIEELIVRDGAILEVRPTRSRARMLPRPYVEPYMITLRLPAEDHSFFCLLFACPLPLPGV